jgi:hypothetical protein
MLSVKIDFDVFKILPCKRYLDVGFMNDCDLQL